MSITTKVVHDIGTCNCSPLMMLTMRLNGDKARSGNWCANETIVIIERKINPGLEIIFKDFFFAK